jgi:hypothetical protein
MLALRVLRLHITHSEEAFDSGSKRQRCIDGVIDSAFIFTIMQRITNLAE